MDRASEAQATAYAVVHHGRDQTGCDALFLLGQCGREQDSRGGERHIHGARHEDHGDEGIRPVGLVERRDGHEKAPQHEEGHGREHDPRDRYLPQQPDGREGEEYPRDGHRAGLGRREQGAVATEVL